MPSLSRITSTFFVNLIGRLGVRPPPPEGFLLANTVQPVSLVDADISIPVAPTSALIDIGNVNTAGELTAPAANTRLATTGPQPAGNYVALIVITAAEANAFRIRRRNAADAADIWSQRIVSGAATSIGTFVISLRVVLAINELLVVEVVNVGSVGVVYQATIFLAGS